VIFVLSHQEARRRALEAVRSCPDGYRVRLDPPKRSLDQNAAIHPIILEIAKAAGRGTDVESLRVLRYLLLEQWRSETKRPPMFERSLDEMRFVDVSQGTSELDKPDCSEFIDFLQAFLSDPLTKS
jgi:hypothetical protein